MKKKILMLSLLISGFMNAQFPTSDIMVQYGFDNNLNDGVNGSQLNSSTSSTSYVNDRFGTANSSISLNGDFLFSSALNYVSNDEADTSISFWLKTVLNILSS